MIDEFQPYYGVVLYSLISSSENSINLRKIPQSRNAFEIVGISGLLIKHSTSRLSPWTFNLSHTEKNQLEEFKARSLKVYLAFSCGYEGVCVINVAELERLVGGDQNSLGRVTIRTVKGGSWSLAGNVGQLPRMKSKSRPWDEFISDINQNSIPNKN